MDATPAEDEKAKEQKLPSNKESLASCYQGSNGGGITSCRDPRFDENSKTEEKNLEASSCSKQVSVCQPKRWVGALVGAVATMGVAYIYYRRSRWKKKSI